VELHITNTLLNEIIEHSRAALPNEACGLLIGRAGRVERVRPVLNSEPSPVSYVFDSMDHLAAMKEIKSDGMELMGIFHSHPDSPPVPSITDIQRAFFPGTREPNYPEAVYLIVGMSEPAPVVKAFAIQGEHVDKVEIRIVH